jgi:hypothetical protein
MPTAATGPELRIIETHLVDSQHPGRLTLQIFNHHGTGTLPTVVQPTFKTHNLVSSVIQPVEDSSVSSSGDRSSQIQR